MSISSRIRTAALGAAAMWFLDPSSRPTRRSSAARRVRAARQLAAHAEQCREGISTGVERLRRRAGWSTSAPSSGAGPLPGGVAGDPSSLDELLAVARAAGIHGAFDVDGALVRCTSCGTSSAPESVERRWLHRLEGASDPDELLTVSAVRCPRCGTLGTLVTRYGPMADADEAEVVLRLPVPTDPDAAPFTVGAASS